MKVRGDKTPGGAFSMEGLPRRPDGVLVRFYENAKPFEETVGGVTTKGWEYDEYQMEVAAEVGLEDTIRAAYPRLLQQAKEAEAGPRIEELKNRLSETDYKIIKCSEYQLAALPAPYDVATLHKERQGLRDEIGRLEGAGV